MTPRRALLGSACAFLVACGTNVDLGGNPPADGGGSKNDGAHPTCAGYAAPDVSAMCKASSTMKLQANGCYNGYYCKVSDEDCQPQSVACGTGNAGHDG
jgi:hypothetical protein